MPDSRTAVVTTGSNATIEVVSNTNNRLLLDNLIGGRSRIILNTIIKVTATNNDTGNVDTIIH